MEIKVIVTMLAVFCAGVRYGKHIICVGLSYRMQELANEGDKEAASMMRRLLEERKKGKV